MTTMATQTKGDKLMLCPRGGYSHTLPIRVCATQQGRDFEAPDLERGIHFSTGGPDIVCVTE